MVVLGSLVVWTCSAAAQELSFNNPTNPPPPLQTIVKREELFHGQPVNRAYVSSGTNQFAFVVPNDFRLDSSDPDRIEVIATDYRCFITFRILDPNATEIQGLQSAALRETVLSRHSGAMLKDEFSLNAANHSGPAFDMEWTNAGGAKEFARMTFIPAKAGVLEFSLQAGQDKAAEARVLFNSFLLSFRSNEAGKLEISPLVDIN